MVALASGDATARDARRPHKAEKLLQPARRSPGSLSAQAAELSGDRAKALEAYKAMLPNDRTRLRRRAGADAA